MKLHDIVLLKPKRTGTTAMAALLAKMCKNRHINSMYLRGHAPANQLKAQCIRERGEDYWKTSKTLVNIRNPWDHHVSLFLMTDNTGSRNLSVSSRNSHTAKIFNKLTTSEQTLIIENFRLHVEKQINGDARSLYRQHYRYTIEGKIIADYIIRMEPEYIFNDLELFSRECNIPITYANQYAAKTRKIVCNSNHFDYRQFYDNKTKNAVAEIRAFEIDAHKYIF